MPSETINKKTRQEWRELGFFYDRDDDAREWRIVGSVAGLRKFAQIVQTYALAPRSTQISEHDHFGPYSYLTIGTWDFPLINKLWIAGPLPDLLRLSALISGLVAKVQVGEALKLREVFAPTSPYELILDVRDDAFDPAKADAGCW